MGIIPTTGATKNHHAMELSMSFIRKRRRNGVVYLEEVENKRIDGKVRQVFLRHIGKEVDGKVKVNIDIDCPPSEPMRQNRGLA
jgi:hypothetical protein